MYERKASRSGRIVTGIMGFMLLAALLLSVFFTVAETDHHCTGEDCPICRCIAQCERVLHQLGSGAAMAAAMMLPLICLYLFLRISAQTLSIETLVSKKVRLND